MGKLGSTWIVREADPINASGAMDTRDNTGPSIAAVNSRPLIAYEHWSYTSWPTSSTGASWPRSISGRSFFQIGSPIAGYGVAWTPYYSRVVTKTGSSSFHINSSWSNINRVYNFPARQNDVRAPSLEHYNGYGGGGSKVAMNYTIQQNAYCIADISTLTSGNVNWTFGSDGIYPQLSTNNITTDKGLAVYTHPQNINSTADTSNMVTGLDIESLINSLLNYSELSEEYRILYVLSE